MKTCEQCATPFDRRHREATAHYAARKFCSRPCADKGRKTTRVENDRFKGRYRQIKVNGQKFLEHRYVVEQHIGRPLRTDEQVHHINHDRLDNRIENLEVVSPAEHGRRHTWRPLTSDCAVCGTEFTPHKTKRGRKQTCSRPCQYQLARRTRQGRVA